MKTRKIFLGAVALFFFGTAAATVRAQSGPMAPATTAPADPDAIDYSALNNLSYTYADLTIAKTRDFSDTTIAKLVKMSEETGTRFSVLSDALATGTTFITLADRYGVPLADLDHVEKQKDEVANYIAAYETSGQYAYPDTSH